MIRLAPLAGIVLVAGGWSSANGHLRVALDDRMNARPIEGYVWFAGLGKAQQAKARTVVLHAAPGRHRFVSYIRTCDGNCGFLDPPSKRCSRVVTLRSGVTRTVTVRLLDGGCRIVVR